MLLRTIAAIAVMALAAPASVRAQPAAADTPSKTGGGASFTLPQAWSLDAKPPLTMITAPEGDTRIVIVEVATAADAAAAAAEAWKLYRPGAGRKLQLATKRAARNGWDEREVFDYETSPNEKAVVQAIAYRKDKAWTVLIVDGTQATFEKRLAAAGLVNQSLRPAGYTRESFAGKTALPLDAARVAALKAFVATSMQQLGIPGAAMALVENGRIVFEGGFGVRELGKPTPVDANTLFMVASNTKGMATLLLATLVDEGKLKWDQPVTQVYPAFRLGSADTTAKVLVKHLVCACTGLPRKDVEWLLNTDAKMPPAATFTQLAATQPTSGFGEVFQYNNLMASAAGYIGGHIAYPERELGAAFDEAMRSRIFAPLGMRDTTFDFARAERGNHARPHGDSLLDGKPTPAAMTLNYAVAPFRPAGGAWSSAHDMILYVRNELAMGKLPGGRQLVTPANLLARRAPKVPEGENSFYGMGLSGNDRWGVPIINHGGSMGGYKSDIMFLPDAGVGAVILTNADNGQSLLRPFMRRLVEVLYDGAPEAAGDVAAAGARIKAEVANYRALLTVPAAAGDMLATRYTSPELGTMTVSRDGPDTVFNFVSFGSKVASRKNLDGTTSFITYDPTNEGIELVVGNRDGKRVLITRDAQHEYVFTEAS